MHTCDSCSNKLDKCAEVYSTGCIRYSGPSIPCLNICTGDSLTFVENSIATKLCEIVGVTDMSTITIPTCLIEAWGTKDKDILNLIQTLLDYSCSLKFQIDSINTELTTFDPLITVDYKCCSDDCTTSGTLKLSKILEDIISCICKTKADLASLTSTVNLQATYITSLQIGLSSLTADVNIIKAVLPCLKTSTGCV